MRGASGTDSAEHPSWIHPNLASALPNRTLQTSSLPWQTLPKLTSSEAAVSRGQWQKNEGPKNRLLSALMPGLVLGWGEFRLVDRCRYRRDRLRGMVIVARRENGTRRDRMKLRMGWQNGCRIMRVRQDAPALPVRSGQRPVWTSRQHTQVVDHMPAVARRPGASQ